MCKQYVARVQAANAVSLEHVIQHRRRRASTHAVARGTRTGRTSGEDARRDDAARESRVDADRERASDGDDGAFAGASTRRRREDFESSLDGAVARRRRRGEPHRRVGG